MDGSRRCHSRSLVGMAFLSVPPAETSVEDEDEDDDAIDDSDAAEKLLDKGSADEAPRRSNGSHAIRIFILKGTVMVDWVPRPSRFVAGELQTTSCSVGSLHSHCLIMLLRL